MKLNDKIYIAGHLGLVGSAIWKRLISSGYTNLIGRSIDELNLLNSQAVAEFFSAEKPDCVILAAAKVGGILANNTYRAQFIQENLVIQNNVIHQAYLHEVKKLLFLGSTCIYPRDAPQPMKENYLLTGPLEYTNEPYAIAKIAGLKMCENYNLQYGTNFISVMPTNLYGPNDNFDLEKSHVLPALLRKIHLGKCLAENDWDSIRYDLNKRPIEEISGKNTLNDILIILKKYGITPSPVQTYAGSLVTPSPPSSIEVEIWGSGSPLREFLWSEEMADACVFIMEKVNFKDLKKWGQEFGNYHINIGTGQEISIRKLVEQIRDVVGYCGSVSFNTSKPDGTMRKLTDPSKLHHLGWHHKIEIEEGIKKLYQWYLNN